MLLSTCRRSWLQLMLLCVYFLFTCGGYSLCTNQNNGIMDRLRGIKDVYTEPRRKDEFQIVSENSPVCTCVYAVCTCVYAVCTCVYAVCTCVYTVFTCVCPVSTRVYAVFTSMYTVFTCVSTAFTRVYA